MSGQVFIVRKIPLLHKKKVTILSMQKSLISLSLTVISIAFEYFHIGNRLLSDIEDRDDVVS